MTTTDTVPARPLPMRAVAMHAAGAVHFVVTFAAVGANSDAAGVAGWLLVAALTGSFVLAAVSTLPLISFLETQRKARS